MVLYKSGPSHARGVGAKRAVKGIVSWAWMVGTNTTGGSWPIYVECGNTIVKTYFTVTG
jgi:micrococcal nuclease